MAAETTSYEILMSSESLHKLNDYKNSLASTNDLTNCGANLRKLLNRIDVSSLTTEKFLEFLLRTKKPCIFAESQLACDGSDWTAEEVSILGDVCVAVEVTVFDNGVWSTSDPQFIPHDEPFEADLLFVPGPLLSNTNAPDYKEVVENSRLNFDKYLQLMNRRLLSVFHYINGKASKEQKAIVTLPGIGCGLFGGEFVDELPQYLNRTLQHILSTNSDRWSNIECVVFVPYEGESKSSTFGTITYRVRPYLSNLKPQLSMPIMFQENPSDDYSSYRLYKIVAWDHLSYPGNDYFRGSRHTDDGVTAAATNSMAKVVGVEGSYDGRGHYVPPPKFATWESVVKAKNVQLSVQNNLRVFIDDL